MRQGLRHIRAFLAVARLGGFTRAAEALNVSQPALTVQIHQLEASLGVRLFDRNKRRVALTEAGKSLMAPLERVLMDLETVLDASQDLAGLRRGTVTVAALPSVAASLLPVVLRTFGQRYPGITVNIRDVVAGRIAQLVRAGEADFGIGSQVMAERDLELSDVLVDRMCAYYPLGHPLDGAPRLSLSDLVAHPLVLTGRDTSVRQLVERAVAKDDLQFVLAGEANYMSTAVGMVRAGLGVAILPESAVDCARCTGLGITVIDGANLQRKIGIVRRADCALSPAAARLADVLREVAAAPPSHFRVVESVPDGSDALPSSSPGLGDRGKAILPP